MTNCEGPRLERPRKLILMILFGFEVDTLEIALREQCELVDKIFLVESTYTHQGVEFTASHHSRHDSTLEICQLGRGRTVKILNIIFYILGPEASHLAKYKDFGPFFIRRGGED